MKKIDLGTLIDVEMYYNSNSLKEKENRKSNTFQHSSENEDAPKALFFPFGTSSGEEASGKDLVVGDVCGLLGGNGSGTQNQPISTKPGYVRLSPQAKYDLIMVQLSNLRIGTRYNRANVYISLQEDTDVKFNVYLTGAATNSRSELYRGCQKSNHVKNIVDDLINRYPNIMIARLRYKPVSGYITDFHKKLTKAAIIGITEHDGVLTAILNLYGQEHVIELTDPLTDKQLKYYIAQGTYSETSDHDDIEE
jgi:hypothetical protein